MLGGGDARTALGDRPVAPTPQNRTFAQSQPTNAPIPNPKSTIVIIPAFNEARAIGRVIGDLPEALTGEVVVVNNASTDETEQNARAAGATVLREERQGYGWACLRGIRYAAAKPPDERPEVLVFLDGDYSDHPDELPRLAGPILRGEADFVVGSRMRGEREAGALPPQSRWGSRLASLLMHCFWGVRYTDLGPFRAIRFGALQALGMEDKTFGWTIEMQIKAAEVQGLRIREAPVSYRQRTGVSKITGTLAGTLKASAKILWTLLRMAATRGKRSYDFTPERSDSKRPRADRSEKNLSGSFS